MTDDSRARWARLLALLTALMLVAAACGGDSDDEETSDPTIAGEDEEESFDERAQAAQEGEDESTAQQEDVEGTGDPVRGGTLVISGPSDIGNLDSITSSSFNTQYRLQPSLQRLLTFETGSDIGYTEQRLVGELATDWEISDDNLTYTFTLREGVTWHDVEPVNGREFTSADVKATFEAILAEGHQANLLERVTSIETRTTTPSCSTCRNRSLRCSTTWPPTSCGSFRPRCSRRASIGPTR